MNTPALAQPSVAALLPRRWAWPRALAGLSPTTIATMVALQYVCALSIVLGRGMRPDLLAATWDHFLLLLATTTPMVLAIVATGNLGPQRGLARFAALAAAVLLGFAAGSIARAATFQLQGVALDPQFLLKTTTFALPRFALAGALIALALESLRHAEATAQAAREAELDRAALEREWDAARLQVLRAQIEPHFLFNTLAHVRHLCDSDAGRGRALLDSLMRYLEAALPQMRQAETTLGQEADLAAAYLDVQRIRMGKRLACEFDIAPELRRRAMPSMMLLTLVENAVKHGIQPAREGGAIRIAATAGAGEPRWQLAVADTGVGFAPGSGAGTGLANIRARLAAQFGTQAALTLQRNDFGGVTATLELPQPGAPGDER